MFIISWHRVATRVARVTASPEVCHQRGGG